MMRKKFVKVCGILFLFIFLLTGCGGDFPDMTREQEDMVGEFAAMQLLKYDANNRSRLVSQEEVEAREQQLLQKKQWEEEQKAKQDQKGMDPVADTPIVDKTQEPNDDGESLEEFFDLPEGVTITYGGNEICESYYPHNSEVSESLEVSASEGKELLVLKFVIANQTQADQTIDILSQNVVFHVTVNDAFTRNALTTMLPGEDMSTYKDNIPAGGSAAVVLLVELDADIGDNVSTVSLKLKNELKTDTIQLQ